MARLSRRKFIGSSTALAAAGLGLPTQSTFAQATSPSALAASPDDVVINARVFTSDAALPNAEAFAVKGDRFIAVGSSADIENLAAYYASQKQK